MDMVWKYSLGMFVENDGQIGHRLGRDLGVRGRDTISLGV